MSPSIPLILSLFLLGMSVLYFLWWFPRWDIRKVSGDLRANDRLDLEIKSRGVLAQIVAGLLFLFGLYFTWKSFELSREGQVSERLISAAEKLGSDQPGVCVAAIAALDKIAQDSPSDRWIIMDVLSSFVRQKAPWEEVNSDFIRCKWRKKAMENEVGEPLAPTEIQAALNVLKRQDWQRSPHPLNLQNTDLRGADLQDGNFQKTIFNKSYLGGADLSDADLRGAHFVYACALEYTQCAGAQTEGAVATGAQMNGLSGCTIAAK